MSRTFECPNCGAAVKAGKKVCRECGSDDATGWMSSEEIDYQSIDIPDGYGPETQLEQDRGRTWVTFVAILLAVALVLLFVLR
ncbi:MAG: putative nucleic acid-binding Zn ribbon protein [Planctomycetota bacterium]|jgi:predicted nucleic acid-binding Zn ribbon protein